MYLHGLILQVKCLKSKAIQQEITSGTNSHAGLLAGKELLDNDKEVEAQRKYMVFVSDVLLICIIKNQQLPLGLLKMMEVF